MERDAEQQQQPSEKRNEALSQSYVEAVERVTRRSIDDAGGFNFNLPKEVLQEREKAWGSFFDKYAKEASNEVELNIKTMEPAENLENERENEEEEEEEEEEKGYYSKCRAPIRKLPALIQYWVDTGNPPYQLVWEEEHSETGSSLSEGDRSRSSGRSALVRESMDNDKVDENSACSSVDTAAYVLSNGNVTEKAKTLEIIMECGGGDGKRCAEDEYLSSRATDRETRASISADVASPRLRAASNASTSNKRSNLTLSEVLPALQQFDQLLQVSKQRDGAAGTRTTIRPSVDEYVSPRGQEKNPEESRPVDVSSKTSNRRKLYTGRNSPIDLILMRRSTDNGTTTTTTTTGAISHPALESANEASENRSSLLLANRVRARRKRKRPGYREADAAQRRTLDAPETVKQRLVRDDKINNNDRPKEGHERYTDFFQSLGLTPSKTTIERDDEEGKKTDSALAHNHRSTSASDLLGNRALTVRIVKLSEECLARYRRSPLERAASSSNPSIDKNPGSIELLTTATHDSDSSTILICSCNSKTNTGQPSGSDYSMSLKSSDSPVTKGIFTRAKNIAGTRSRNAEIVEAKAGNLIDSRNPTVRLEKLSIDQQPTNQDDLSFLRAEDTKGSRCLTIGSRDFDKSGATSADKNGDEDDDNDAENFTRLVRKVASTRRDSRNRRSSRKRSKSIAEAHEAETRRCHDVLGIAPSSDEDQIELRSGSNSGIKRSTKSPTATSQRDVNSLDVASNDDLFTELTDQRPKARRREYPSRAGRGRRGKRARNFDEPAIAPTRFRTRLDSDSDSDNVRGAIVGEEIASRNLDNSAKEPSDDTAKRAGGSVKSDHLSSNHSAVEKKIIHRSSSDATKAVARRKKKPKRVSNSSCGVEISQSLSDPSPEEINASAADSNNDADISRRKLKGASRRLLPDIFDDTLENFDELIFGGDDERSPKGAIVKDFHLETPKFRRKITIPRQSTITFRTRLTDDSDHDDDAGF